MTFHMLGRVGRAMAAESASCTVFPSRPDYWIMFPREIFECLFPVGPCMVVPDQLGKA